MKKITRNFCLVLAVLMIVSLFSACGKTPVDDTRPIETTLPAVETVPTEEVDPFEQEKAEYEAMSAQQLMEKYVADPANITVEEYCALIATYAFVPVTEEGEFEYENKTKEALSLVKDAGGKIPSSLDETVSAIMLAHPYPNARAYYYRSLINSFAGVDTPTYNGLLAQYRNETDPFVIGSMIYGISKSLGNDTGFCEYALSLADREEGLIRYNVAYQLSRLEAADRESLVAAGLKLMADPDTAVREAAMGSCGTIADDRFVEPLDAVLKDMDQISFHSAAGKAMVKMWYHGNLSEAAYKATLEYFKAESTNPDYPYWSVVNEMTTKTGSLYDAWRAEASYFDVNEVVESMVQLVLDAETVHLTKTSALKVIAAHGTADDLNALKATLESMTGMEKYIEEIDKQLEKM